MSKDSVVLSYEEALLRESDVKLLKGPHWLNDNIISFYFEYLKNFFNSPSHILYVSPEVTQCIKITPISQLDIFFEPLDANTKEFIFFALNDNENPQFVGGTHWSLILLSMREQVIHHYDSSRGSNADLARVLAKKLFSYFKMNGEYKEEAALQQCNGVDCGIHVVCNVEYLTKFLITDGREVDHLKLNENISSNVSGMRKKILKLIDELRANSNGEFINTC